MSIINSATWRMRKRLEAIYIHVATGQCYFCKNNAAYEYGSFFALDQEVLAFVCTHCGQLIEVELFAINHEQELWELYLAIQQASKNPQNQERKLIKGQYDMNVFFEKYGMLTVSEKEVYDKLRETQIKIVK